MLGAKPGTPPRLYLHLRRHKQPRCLGNYLGAIALLPRILILPGTRLNTALDEHERSLLQILLTYFGQTPPGDDIVKLGGLLSLPRLILVKTIGGHAKRANALPRGSSPQ